VEDFSEQWWALVQSSPWFRNYWLQECFQDPQNDPQLSDIDDLDLPDIDSLFDDYSVDDKRKFEIMRVVSSALPIQLTNSLFFFLSR
jgi:hypothetical protein